jgi:hypothetical protein
VQRCGPVGMFLKLLQIWDHLNPLEIAAKVSQPVCLCVDGLLFYMATIVAARLFLCCYIRT